MDSNLTVLTEHDSVSNAISKLSHGDEGARASLREMLHSAPYEAPAILFALDVAGYRGRAITHFWASHSRNPRLTLAALHKGLQ